MYPSDEELARIQNWEVNQWEDYKSLMEYVKEKWYDTKRFHGPIKADVEPHMVKVSWYLSTGGWRSNEDLIEALKDNVNFWNSAWYKSQRGGHYEFKIKV